MIVERRKNPSTQAVRTNPKTITTFRNMEFLPVACLQNDFTSCKSRTQYILRDLTINGQKINLYDAEIHNRRTYNDYVSGKFFA